MAERFTSDLVFILVVLLVTAIVGIIIGYLCRKNKFNKILKGKDTDIENLRTDLEYSKKETNKIKTDLDSCKKESDDLKLELKICNQELSILRKPFDAIAAKEFFKVKVIENDLKIIEGIGEKIEHILKNRGIKTWIQLALSKPENIKEILLTDGGSGYQIHEPRTWPQQAQMAYEGKWKELKEYQDELTGGR